MASNKKQKPWLAIGAVVILAGIGWTMFRNTSDPAQQTAAVTAPTNPALLPIDTTAGQTLSPELFLDPKAKEAYQVAKDIPDVLRELPCFCGCMSTHGHKNNLFCFMDEHGSACEVCQDIALDARTMHRNGASASEIRDNIRAKYAQNAAAPQ